MNKQTVVTLVLTLLVTNYASFQAGQTVRYYKTSAPPARRSATASSARVYGVNQVLSFTPTRVDFGRITGLASQSRVVSFQNRGQEAVVIKQVKASCSCTVASVNTPDIPPGGQGQMTVVVNPATSSPELAVSISVEYEGKPQVDRLLVSGQVIPKR